MHLLLQPYLEANKDNKINEIKNSPLVLSCVVYTDYIAFTTKEELPNSGSRIINPSKNEYRCYEVLKLSKKVREEGRVIPSGAPKYHPSLFFQVIQTPLHIDHDIDGHHYSMPFEEAIIVAQKRCWDISKSLYSLLDLHNDLYNQRDRERALVDFLRNMTEHVFYKNHPDFEKSKILKQLKRRFDEKFVKFWIKEHKISDQQLTCDHDNSDQFSTDGYWYNSVGICRKCLIDVDKSSFEDVNDECEKAYKIWKASKKANGVKK